MPISDYSSVRDNNASIPPGDIRSDDFKRDQQIINSIRQLMADIAQGGLSDIGGLTRNRGDLIVGGASAWTDLPLGAAQSFLGSDGTDVLWRSATQTRADLGLGTGALEDTGTSGHTLPFLDGNNIWSGSTEFNGLFGVGRPGIVTGGLYFNRDPDNPFILFSFGTSPGSAISQLRSTGASGVIGFANAAGTYGFTYAVSSRLNTVIGSFSRGSPVTKTANFTVAATENWLINNKAGSSCVVTLPSASSFPGREIMLQSYQAQTTVSASANVVQKGGASTTTAILPATVGAWCVLVSNGTNWVIMMSGT